MSPDRIATLLITASTTIAFVLGVVHLLYTFVGTRLHPRDPALILQMQAATMRLTRETTVWRAWIGFNASHALGLLLFGLVYGFLGLQHPELLLRSMFLLGLGLLALLGYVVLAWRYWFSIPLGGIGVAALMYVAGLGALAWHVLR